MAIEILPFREVFGDSAIRNQHDGSIPKGKQHVL